MTLEGFETPFNNSLSPDNRWVKLSEVVDWDKFAISYIKMMNAGFGRPGISPRIVLGALIIKHKENLDDRGTIYSIQENPYMQYFLGLKGFTTKPVFDPSLFVEIRKRIGSEIFDQLTIQLIQSLEPKRALNSDEDKEDNPPKNKGKLQMDATVADQAISYPTDSNLLNTSRKKCEAIIDFLYELDGKKGTKPRTYRKKLDKAFLNYAKKKRKSKQIHRTMCRKLLEGLKRNLGHINTMLDKFEVFPLIHFDQRMLWIIGTLYDQQKQMFDTRSNSCKNRIVSIFQPHVRPIPRGKSKAQVEFGSKLGVSLDNGFARIDTLSWDAYSEGKDFVKQIENYHTLHGYYPELVQVDKAYHTRENRAYAKEKNIRLTAKSLGRKPKEKPTAYQKKKRKTEAAERNHIEGKFGQGKNGYRLNYIRARIKETSESWIACIFYVMNLINYQKKYPSSSFFENICLLLTCLLPHNTITKWSMAYQNNFYGNYQLRFSS